MKKLIEFRDDKHADVISIIARYRADNNTTFSEAVRRLILVSEEDKITCEETTPPTDGRIEAVEKKVEILVKASKAFKNYMERDDSGHS